MKAKVTGLFFWVLLLSLLLNAFLAGRALATPPGEDGEHKVAICHRTASDTTPYVFIEVDEASLSPGHLDNADPGHKPTYWKSDGTWRGVAHVAGDPKDDYLAQSEADCEDTVTPSPTPTPTPTTPPPTPTETPTPTPPPTSSETPTPPPSTETPPPSSHEPPKDCDGPDCKPPAETAMTGGDATVPGIIAAGLFALGMLALWFSRKLRM